MYKIVYSRAPLCKIAPRPSKIMLLTGANNSAISVFKHLELIKRKKKHIKQISRQKMSTTIESC